MLQYVLTLDQVDPLIVLFPCFTTFHCCSVQLCMYLLLYCALRNPVCRLHLPPLSSPPPPPPPQSRSGVVDSLASSVIQVFEDSCSEEWVGQHMETDQGDGAHSPPIWLVTPLISKLPAIVLGRVLKNAGTVLGRGQWWSLEKSLEKKRTTRQTRCVCVCVCGVCVWCVDV